MLSKNIEPGSGPVMIGIDPHKASWTAAAVNSRLQPVATIRIPVSRDGYRALREFAAQWPDATWAIEGASGLGALIAATLPGSTGGAVLVRLGRVRGGGAGGEQQQCCAGGTRVLEHATLHQGFLS